MSTFSPADVANIAQGGNANFNLVYLAKARRSKDYEPYTGNNIQDLRNFIQAKYVELRWFSEDGLDYEPPSPVAPLRERIVIEQSNKVMHGGGVKNAAILLFFHLTLLYQRLKEKIWHQMLLQLLGLHFKLYPP
jgi:hypothetical protein